MSIYESYENLNLLDNECEYGYKLCRNGENYWCVHSSDKCPLNTLKILLTNNT